MTDLQSPTTSPDLRKHPQEILAQYFANHRFAIAAAHQSARQMAHSGSRLQLFHIAVFGRSACGLKAPMQQRCLRWCAHFAGIKANTNVLFTNEVENVIELV